MTNARGPDRDGWLLYVTLFLVCALLSPALSAQDVDILTPLPHDDQLLALWNQLYDQVAAGDVDGGCATAHRILAHIDDLPVEAVSDRMEANNYLAWLEGLRGLDEAAMAEHIAMEALQREVNVHVTRGDAAGAVEPITRLLAERERLCGEDHPTFVDDLTIASAIHRTLGDHVRAEQLAERALDLCRRREDVSPDDEVDVLIAVSGVRLMRNRLDDALSAVDEAVAIAGTVALEADTLMALSNLRATLAMQRGYRREAAEHLAQALAVAAAVLPEGSPDHLVLIANLATIWLEMGEFTRAEPLLQRGVQLAELLPVDTISHGLMFLGLGDLYAKRGETARALPLVLEGLTLLERQFGPGHSQYANGLRVLADCLEDQGHDAQAESVRRTSVDVLAQTLGARHPITASAERRLARRLQENGRAEEALALLERLADTGGEAQNRRLALLELARQLHLAGRQREALDALDEAAAWLPEGTSDEPAGRVVQAELAARRGMLQLQTDDVEGALTSLEQAVTLYEAGRVALGRGFERAAYLASPHAWLAEARLRSGDVDGAWRAAEGRRARALLDLLSAPEGAPGLRDARRPRLVDRVEHARAAFDAAAPGARDAQRATLVAAESALAEHERRADGAAAPAAFEVHPRTRVQAGLAEDTALIGWLTGIEGGRWVWVLRHEGPVSWHALPRHDDPLQALADDVHDACVAAPESLFGSAPALPRDDAEALAAATLGPALERLAGVRQLVVVPSDLLAHLPVEALLLPDGRWVDEAFEVSYVPSATVATWLAERPPRAPTDTPRLLLVGDPPFRAEHAAAMADEGPASDLLALRGVRSAAARFDPGALPRLPGTRREVEHLAGLAGNATVLLGRDASEQRLDAMAARDELAAFDVIHLATHARADAEHPERSELVLSQVGLPDRYAASLAGEPLVDGRLDATEILGRWRIDARLVTLSACSTSRGRELPGEGAVGLAQAFLQVGARRLLLTRWPVDDEAASRFMAAFYDAFLGQDVPAAQAAARARAALRDYEDERGRHPFAHPGHWAAFVLVAPAD